MIASSVSGRTRKPVSEEWDFLTQQKNPFFNQEYFERLVKPHLDPPFGQKKWLHKVHDTLLAYKRKYDLHGEYSKIDSSLNQARKLLTKAEELRALYSGKIVWDYYYDTGDAYDVTHGLNQAINALKRMLSYAEPPRRINLSKADPDCVRMYAKSWARTHTGFDEWVDEIDYSEVIKLARKWIQENNARVDKPNIKSARTELVQDLSYIWQSAMKIHTKSDWSARSEAKKIGVDETGKPLYGGRFLDFLHIILTAIGEDPEREQFPESLDEWARLNKQSLFKLIKRAL